MKRPSTTWPETTPSAKQSATLNQRIDTPNSYRTGNDDGRDVTPLAVAPRKGGVVYREIDPEPVDRIEDAVVEAAAASAMDADPFGLPPLEEYEAIVAARAAESEAGE